MFKILSYIYILYISYIQVAAFHFNILLKTTDKALFNNVFIFSCLSRFHDFFLF